MYAVRLFSLFHTLDTSLHNISLTSDRLSEVLQSILPVFDINSLRSEQEMALHAFLNGKDVFVNFPTGFGKSIIYQLAPLVSSRFEELSPNSGLGKSDAILVVVSPLISLMKDQVAYLQERNVKATHISGHLEKKAVQDIVDGKFTIVYASPECLLASQLWRKMLVSKIYKNRLIAIAVDEAHCISQW